MSANESINGSSPSAVIGHGREYFEPSSLAVRRIAATAGTDPARTHTSSNAQTPPSGAAPRALSQTNSSGAPWPDCFTIAMRSTVAISNRSSDQPSRAPAGLWELSDSAVVI